MTYDLNLPLIRKEKGNDRYVPIPEREWNKNVSNFVFPKLENDKLLEINYLYREMRVEYLYGEFRGETSKELEEFLEYLIVNTTQQ